MRRRSFPKCVLMLAALWLSGCQAGAVGERSPEHTFQRMWALYQQCRSVTDLAHVLTAAEHLDQLAREDERNRRPPPRMLRVMIASPPVRLAADPKAMSAACLTRADQMAAVRGRVAVNEHFMIAPGQRVTVRLAGAKGTIFLENLQ